MSGQISERDTRAELAAARSAVYGALAELALHPSLENQAGEPTNDTDRRPAALQDACAVLAGEAYAREACRSIAGLQHGFAAAAPEALAAEYVRIFGHTLSKECPPYEAQYGAPHLFEQTRTLADLAGFYRAFGLEVRPGAGERLDHLGIELEFMQVLTYKEAFARVNHGEDRAGLCREAEEKFLREHLGTWVSDFADRLMRRAAMGPYADYAQALRSFIDADMTHLSIAPLHEKTLKPQAELPESPTCGLSCGSLPSGPSQAEAG